MAEQKKSGGIARWIGVIIGLTILWFIKGWLIPSTETLYYDNGAKKAEGQIKNGKERGEWTYWYESGQVEAVQNYTEGALDGPVKWYYPDGKLKKEGAYKENLSNGDWTFYYPSGQVQSKGTIVNDQMAGQWVEYDENGQKTTEGNYEQGLPNGKWTYFFPNGNVEATGELKAGKETGEWSWFYASGKPSRKVRYDEHGTFTQMAWDLAGTPTLTDGNGIVYQYFADSTIQSETTYQEGKSSGHFIAYYETGAIREMGQHVEGVYRISSFRDRSGAEMVKNGSGKYVFTSEKGTKIREGQYENGLQTGEWRTYQLDGTPLIICDFANGKMNGNFVQFYQNGAIQSRGKMLDDQKTGKWIYYDERGKKVEEEDFK